MADTADLKSAARFRAYGFESRLRHFLIRTCSRASAFRALAELCSFGLVAPMERGLAIVPNAREALRLAEPRIRSSPVRESLLAAVYG